MQGNGNRAYAHRNGYEKRDTLFHGAENNNSSGAHRERPF
jgi:hypothetical protein